MKTQPRLVSDLIDGPLDWAVIVALFGKHEATNAKHVAHFIHLRGEDTTRPVHPLHREGHYSTNWAEAGPIIEREKIDLSHAQSGSFNYAEGKWWSAAHDKKVERQYGSTPLVAAMRCYVASKLGEFVEIPEELL